MLADPKPFDVSMEGLGSKVAVKRFLGNPPYPKDDVAEAGGILPPKPLFMSIDLF